MRADDVVLPTDAAVVVDLEPQLGRRIGRAPSEFRAIAAYPGLTRRFETDLGPLRAGTEGSERAYPPGVAQLQKVCDRFEVAGLLLRLRRLPRAFRLDLETASRAELDPRPVLEMDLRRGSRPGADHVSGVELKAVRAFGDRAVAPVNGDVPGAREEKRRGSRAVDGVRNGDGEHRERSEHDDHRFHDARPFMDDDSRLDSRTPIIQERVGEKRKKRIRGAARRAAGRSARRRVPGPGNSADAMNPSRKTPAKNDVYAPY